MLGAYLDLDDVTLIWVPADPRNRHYRFVQRGFLAAADAATEAAQPGEVEQAQAARAAAGFV